jgi:peptidoglycan hydrolase-like protein with peptidoglycan-binding domain
MRSTLIAGVSVVALSLGGCSWFGQSSGSSSSQITPVPSGGPHTVTAPSQAQSRTPAPMPAPSTAAAAPQQQAQTATTSKSASHHMTASNEVRQAQQKLKDDGEYKGKIDGLAGPQTHKALVAYQQKNNLKQTGHLDQATKQKLGLASASSSSSSGSSMPAKGGSSSGGGNAPSGGATPPMSNQPAGTPQH